MTKPGPDQVTRVLKAIGEGDPHAAEELLPLVYDSLRRLAQKRMTDEPTGQTLQATALVHEAYLRLLGEDKASWQNRKLFYAAAAEAMRRILIERARKYQRARHGGGRRRVPLDEVEIQCELPADKLVALDQAMNLLADVDGRAHEVVMLRCFGGLNVEQIAELQGLSPSTIDREWRTARVWLYDQIIANGTRQGRGS